MRETTRSQDRRDHSKPIAGLDHNQESADIEECESDEGIDAEVLVHRRPSARKRAVQVELALLCGLAVLALFHAITPVAVRPPTLTPLARTSRSQVTIVANLNFGSVTVNGKKLAGKPPFLFSAAPSGDTVIYVAPPFAPRSCHLFWYGSGASAQLGAGGSNCQMSSETVRVSSWAVTSSYVLNFQFGLDDLPAALQATALDFVRQVITPASLPITVPRGQYYATGRDGRGMILSRQATTPLTAVISLLLFTPQDLVASSSWCSELICPALDIPPVRAAIPAPAGQLWAVQIPSVMSWQFLLPDGQGVGTEHQSQTSSDATVVLALDAQQRWHLASFVSPTAIVDERRLMIPNSLCTTGMIELSSALQDHQAGGLELSTSIDHGLAGCEIQITQTDGTVTGTAVWRLGVLLAADAKTHAAYSWLPTAPYAEVAIMNGE